MPESSLKTPLIVLVLTILCLGIGFGVGYNYKSIFGGQQTEVKNPETQGIFKTQSASIEGKVTEIGETTVTVVNDQGQTNNLTFSDRLVIYKPETRDSPSSTAFTNIKNVNLNEKALILLEMIDGKYQVVSISHENL